MRTADLAAALNVKPAAANGAKPDTPTVSFDEKGKLVLGAVPAVDDIAGQGAWLTAVFNLDPAHPVTRAERQGIAGPEGHAELHRAGAPSIRLEPIKVVSAPARLIESINGWAIPTDGPMHAIKGEHCRLIAHVVRVLCGTSARVTVEQETHAILGAFQQSAKAVEGLTIHGTSAQRFEAADALGGHDPADRDLRYLIDLNTGELIIRVSDLADVARRHEGSSLPRGWLDARLAAIGFQRATLDGHALEGRSGRTGPHARCAVYRGVLPHAEGETEGA
jgi:hypothetical protein